AAPRYYGMERRDREHRTKQIFMGMFMVSGKSFIASCGEIPNVPLMGPRGCISYTPTLVLDN
ncbi:hypothetical protein PIB30_103396, partial [Stylosanthes scabra]|nr:hypothetical protein [Stylosanthes scabra]